MKDLIKKFNHKIRFGLGSSTGNPDFKGMQTCDIKLWVKFDDYEWFKPYGHFEHGQIISMIDMCKTEYQLVSLFELLSAKKQVENI